MTYFDAGLHPLAAENAMLRKALQALLPMVPQSSLTLSALVNARVLLGLPTKSSEPEDEQARLARRRAEFDADDGA